MLLQYMLMYNIINQNVLRYFNNKENYRINTKQIKIVKVYNNIELNE